MSNIKTLRKSILSGRTTAVSAVEESLKKIKSESDLNCWINIYEKESLEKASEIDEKIKKGENPGKLGGIPIAIKDNMLVKGMKTTNASAMLKDYVSPYTATVVEKLSSEGAVIIGKTNMDEFAMGSSGETSAFGVTRNPVDTERSPGGSSSGSAAAIAAGHVPASLGSDTGGSIRQPAAFCGIVGMKPTYGVVSRYGISPFASSLDQAGPLAATVEDTAAILEVIAGYDRMDSTSIKREVPCYAENIEGSIEGVKIGIPSEYMQEGTETAVRERVLAAAGILEKLGAEIKEISLPLTKYAVSVYYIIAPAEASANLARLDGIKYGLSADSGKDFLSDVTASRTEGFGSEVKRRIMLGTYVLSSGYYEDYYIKAQKARTLIKNEFSEAFKIVDLIFAPTSPTTAFGLGEKTGDILKMYLSDVFTISANLAGIPALNLPVGLDSKNLPVGAQFMGNYLSEELIFRVARALEKEIKSSEKQ